MFEKLVIHLLNKYLGGFIKDLDADKINLGISNGKIELFNLTLKPEVLHQLNLPIEVIAGTIGYVKIVIPWRHFHERPLIISIDSVFAIVGSVKSRTYDEDFENNYWRIKKNRILNATDANSPDAKGKRICALERSLFSTVDNVQISVTNIHLKYEESNKFTKESPFVFGVLLHKAIIETTNNKWRSGLFTSNQPSVFKLLKFDSLSIYWNPFVSQKNLAVNFLEDNSWKNMLGQTLETFTINGEECQFLIKPVSAKVKAIISKAKENKVANILLDFVVQDVCTQVSHIQYLSITQFCDSLRRTITGMVYKKFYPNLQLIGHARLWWHYAINSVLHIVRTFSWPQIKCYRERYKSYRKLFYETLTKSSESRYRLFELEDKLNVCSIVLAREEAKFKYIRHDKLDLSSPKLKDSWWKAKLKEMFKNDCDLLSYPIVSHDEVTKFTSTENEILENELECIDYKIIFTLANCSISLLNSFGQEVIVASVSHFLTNLSTSGLKIRSFSLRLEGILIEGITAEQELVPIVQADNFLNASTSPYIFALDIGARHQHQPNSDYVITIATEPVEILYQQSVLDEIKTFLGVSSLKGLCNYNLCLQLCRNFVDFIMGKFSFLAVPINKKIHISCYLKCPTIIIPEFGTLQKEGNLMVVDFGHLGIQSLLVPSNGVESSTFLLQNMEILFNDVNVLFVDSGDAWRIGRMQSDSEFHVIPKSHMQIQWSNVENSVYKCYRNKCNIALPSFKLNLSNRRLKQLLQFWTKLPLFDCSMQHISANSDDVELDKLWEPNIRCLNDVSNRMADCQKKDHCISRKDASINILLSKESCVDSEIVETATSRDSIEIKEQWARSVDLPGLEDNVSPTNFITSAVSLVIGEVVIHMARSSDHSDKPYLMLRLEKLSIDVAIMKYGPALQISVGSLQLVDKLHIDSSGQYLELFNSDVMANENVILFLYRKVSSDCPDFITHFHSVEQSLVIALEKLKTTFHQGAIVTILKYLEYMSDSLNLKDLNRRKVLEGFNERISALTNLSTWFNLLFRTSLSDPPVPTGATKYSISFRFDRLNVKLCDSEVQLAEVALTGLEMDFLQKANERRVFHVYLQHFSVLDLSDASLYSKIINPEDDKVFELKYVQNCVLPCKHILADDIPQRKCDMHLKVQMGKLKICLLSKFVRDTIVFFDFFLQYQIMKIQSKIKILKQKVVSFIKQGSVVNLSVDIQAPVLIIPQKQCSPNAVVVQLGDIGLENYVKAINNQEGLHFADSILVRWNNIQINRVSVTYDGTFHNSEIILEQAKIRLDIIREIVPAKRDCLISVSGVMDTIKISIGHRDFALLLSICKESILIDDIPKLSSDSDIASPSLNVVASDIIGTKLQAFFNTSVDIVRETNFHFTLEGAEIVFGNEKRINKRALTVIVLQLEETNIDFDVYNNGYLEMKCSIQSISLEDIRQDATTKILSSFGDDCKTEKGNKIPPLIYVSYKREPNCDVQVNIMMEKIRLNLSTSNIITLIEYMHEAWLYDQHCTGDTTENLCEQSSFRAVMAIIRRIMKYRKRQIFSSSSSCSVQIPASHDETSWIVKASFKEPEILFHVDNATSQNQTLLLKMDISVNKIIKVENKSLCLSIKQFQIVSFTKSKKWQSVMIIHPCDVDFSKVHLRADLNTNIKLIISPINLNISPSVVQIVKGIISELHSISKFHASKYKAKIHRQHETRESKDLWEIKKLANDCIDDCKDEYDETKVYQKTYGEHFTISLASLLVSFELDLPDGRLPVFIYTLKLETEANDWSRQLYLKGEIQMEASVFNSEMLTWEWLLEPVMLSEGHYRPCEFVFKVFRQTACPVICNDIDYILSSGSHSAFRSQTISESSSSDETNSDDAMTIIRKPCCNRYKVFPKHKGCVRSTVDSVSDNENEIMDKLTTAFGHMLSSESSDDQFSECEGHLDIIRPDDNVHDLQCNSSEGECSVMASPFIVDNSTCMSRQRSEDSVDSGVEDTSSCLATHVMIDVKDKLNFTVSPLTIRAINEIIECFKSKPTVYVSSTYSGSPVHLSNKIGFASSITVIQNFGNEAEKVLSVVTDKDSDFHLSPASTVPEIDIGSTSEERVEDNNINFLLKESTGNEFDLNYNEKNVTEFYQHVTKEKVHIDIDGFDRLQCYLPDRSSTRIFTLHPQKNDTTYHVAINVDVHRNFKAVHVSSPLQIINCLEQAVHLYYIKDVLDCLELSPISHLKNPFGEYIWLATIQPEDTYYVPLYAAYHCPIFFQPAYLNYQVSENSVWWQDLSTTSSRFITCPSKISGKLGYSFKAWCKEINSLKSTIGMGRLIPKYVISLHPPVTVHNYLPTTIVLSSSLFEKDIKLEPGVLTPVVLIDIVRGQRVIVEVPNYNGFVWKGAIDIHEGMEHNKTICMTRDAYACGKQHRQLYLDLKIINIETMHIYIYVPYWIVNKTNLPLQFRGSGSSVSYDSIVSEDPVLFRFKHNGRRRFKTRVYNSRWSVSYSIDNVGNCGVVMCKDAERNKKYKFFLNIDLSKTQMTKIITLRPYFVVVNLTKYHLRFLERNDKTDLWIDIGPHETLPIWPDTKSMQMNVKIRDSKIVSQSFFINRTDCTIFRMDHGTALCVNVCGGQQSPWTIIFKNYIPGSAPVKVENRCDDIFLKFHQISMCQVTLLSPFESVLYTWDDPTKERTIVWNICNRKKAGFTACINKDGFGQETLSFHTVRPNVNNRQAINNRRKSYAYRPHQSSSDDDSDVANKNPQQSLNKKIRSDKVVIYWVSYLKQNQRVLMFTQNDNIAQLAKKKISGSNSRLEWCLSIHNVGLSLIGENYKEVAYACLSDAPSVWDVEINHKWKILPLELSAWLEMEFKRDQTRAEMTGYVQVDFDKMQMTKPFFGRLRRRYSPSIWCQYRCSEYLSFVNLTIHRFQVDNQLQDAVVSTVLYPAPILPQMVSKCGFRPFLELCLVQRHDPKQAIKVIKYFKVLLQEFNLHLDTEFLESVSKAYKAMFSSITEVSDSKENLHRDLAVVQAPIVSSKLLMQADSQKPCMFEYIHLSPIKFNFNFSPKKMSHPSKNVFIQPKSNLLDYILSSIGASLNEVKDVELRLVYFERKGVMCPSGEILSEIKNHYFSQGLSQSYVYIAGVDVLGNPYVFPRDFTQDLGDQYYEPSLGIVRLAEEYAEPTAIEMKRLLGHYISRNRKTSYLLNGYLEQVQSYLCFDEDYKKKELKKCDQSTFPDSLAIASKTLCIGVIMGISGVSVKPSYGIHQSGVEAYLKGIGKGLLGIICKSVDSDMLEIAFDGIRRAEEIGEDIVCRMRLPRFVDAREGVSPYSPYKAAGQRLVWKLSKGHYAETDTYWAHVAMSNNDQSRIILITDRHIFELIRNRVWVDWNIAWKMSIDDIIAIPIIAGNRMVIRVREDKSSEMFPGNECYIIHDDVNVLYWLKQKIEKVLIAHMECRPCPDSI